MPINNPTVLYSHGLSNTVTTVTSTSSFTPTAGALVGVIVALSNRNSTVGVGSGISDTWGDTGGTAWTLQQALDDDNGSGETALGLFTRQIGTGPSSGTVSVPLVNDADSHTMIVWEIDTGFRTTTPVEQVASTITVSTSVTVTLAEVPAAGAMVLGVVTTRGGETNITPGAGFTELIDIGNGTIGRSLQTQVQYDNGGADTTCDWSNLFGTNSEMAIAIEIAEEPSGTNVSDGQAAYVAGAAEVSLYGRWYQHYHEYSGWSGSAFDVVASVTFTHATAPSITTEMFYIGNNQFAWRFTGTTEGEWSWTTSSAVAELNGHSGTITVTARESSNHKGFIAGSTEKRWVWSDGTVFTPQIVSFAGAGYFNDDYSLIDTFINEFIGTSSNHGFTGLRSAFMGWIWQAEEYRTSTVSADSDPLLHNFDAYDELVWRVYNAGGHVHFWWFGESAENSASTNLAGGANGVEDERAQRYIAARLGPLPGWTCMYGFDLSEWATDVMISEWVTNLEGWWGWNHLKSARGNDNAYTRVSAAGDYTSWSWHEPTYTNYLDHISNADAGEPVYSEDAFRIRGTPIGDGKDYTEEQTRRGLYHSFFAGGVANIWSYIDGATDENAVNNIEAPSLSYTQPHWILNYAKFVQDRFSLTATPDNSLTNVDAFALDDATEGWRMFYREAAGSVDIDLTGFGTIGTAVAVDTTAVTYTEIDISGDLTTGQDNTWTAPSTTDWAIYVEETTASPVTVNANVGVISLPGQSATLEVGAVTVSATVAVISLTGQQGEIAVGAVTISASISVVSLAAQQATVTPGEVTLSAVARVVSVAGLSATVEVAGAQTISATVGVISLVKPAASVVPGAVSVAANQGEVAVGGQVATVVPGAITVVALTGSTGISGQTAAVEPGAATISAVVGLIQIAGQSATVTAIAGEVVSASVGTIAVSGQAATVVPGEATVAAVAGVVPIQGQVATVTVAGAPQTVSASTGIIAVGGQLASVQPGTVIVPGSVTTLSLAGQQASILTGATAVSANAGLIIIAAIQASVFTGTLLKAQVTFKGMGRGMFKRM